MENVDILIYTVALTIDINSSKFQEIVEDYKATINGEWFSKTPVLIIFTKYDLVNNKEKAMKMMEIFNDTNEKRVYYSIGDIFQNSLYGNLMIDIEDIIRENSIYPRKRSTPIVESSLSEDRKSVVLSLATFLSPRNSITLSLDLTKSLRNSKSERLSKDINLPPVNQMRSFTSRSPRRLSKGDFLTTNNSNRNSMKNVLHLSQEFQIQTVKSPKSDSETYSSIEDIKINSSQIEGGQSKDYNLYELPRSQSLTSNNEKKDKKLIDKIKIFFSAFKKKE